MVFLKFWKTGTCGGVLLALVLTAFFAVQTVIPASHAKYPHASSNTAIHLSAKQPSGAVVGVEPILYGQRLRIGLQIDPAQLSSRAIADGKAGASPPFARTWQLSFDGRPAAETDAIFDPKGKTQELIFTLPSAADASTEGARRVAGIWTADGLDWFGSGVRTDTISVSTKAVGSFAAIITPDVATVPLRIFYPPAAIVGTILLCVFGSGILWLATSTGMLWDARLNDWSLCRTQIAFWFGLIAAAFLYIWLLTGAWSHVVTNGALVLLGISSLTAIAGSATVSTSAQAIVSASLKPGLGGFLVGLLSDGPPSGLQSIAIHRVIMLTWTLILGAVFATTVITTSRFPEFDASLLLLTGITDGVYLGFKKFAK